MSKAQYQQWADEAARAEGIDPRLFRALVTQESGWNAKATSDAGAAGLVQLMPGTARGLGVTDVYDPRQSLRGGAKYLAQQLRTFGNDPRKALAAYNAGPGAVQKYGGIPPFAETQAYVSKIMGALGGDTSGASGPPDAQQGTEMAIRGQIDPVTLIGQGGREGPDELSLVMDMLAGKSSVLEMAAGVKAARENGPQDIVLPGQEGYEVETSTPTLSQQETGSENSPSLPSGGLGPVVKEVKDLMTRNGFTQFSGQRTDARNAEVGGASDSDHLMRPDRQALDIPMTGEARLQAEGARIAKRLGVTQTSPGMWGGTIKSGKKRIRVQIIAGAAHDHGDHVHVGFRAA